MIAAMLSHKSQIRFRKRVLADQLSLIIRECQQLHSLGRSEDFAAPVDKIQEDPYRFLICADKFQTGYDEPLLHNSAAKVWQRRCEGATYSTLMREFGISKTTVHNYIEDTRAILREDP